MPVSEGFAGDGGTVLAGEPLAGFADADPLADLALDAGMTGMWLAETSV